MKRIKLRNVFFPIWLIFIFPPIIILSFIINFMVDSLVLLLGAKKLKIHNRKDIYKKTIIPIFILGFIADIIGAALLLISQFITNDFWYKNIITPLMLNPFSNIFAFLYCTIVVIITGLLIYIFNKNFTFKKLDVSNETKHKLSLSLAIFTAPFFFYFPSIILYKFLI